jgi:exodeoxyribonuclease VII small subunit
MPKESKQETFEQIYARLEEAVAKLEEGGLPLEQAIALYEEGMELARRCQERLDTAELRITKLRESFAPMPDRSNGAQFNDEQAEYEYVADESDANQIDEDEPFT